MLNLFGVREDYDEEKRVVKQENVTFNGVDYYISTIDLGIAFDDRFYFESMVFLANDWTGEHQERYSTREEAAEGHERIKKELLNGELFGGEKDDSNNQND